MTITDIIALAKAGYKKKDIDELLKMPEPEKQEQESIKEKVADVVAGYEAEIEKDLKEGTHVAAVPEGFYDKEDEEQATPQIPAKSDADKEVERLRKELNEAQKVNAMKDISGAETETDADILTKALQAFM